MNSPSSKLNECKESQLTDPLTILQCKQTLDRCFGCSSWRRSVYFLIYSCIASLLNKFRKFKSKCTDLTDLFCVVWSIVAKKKIPSSSFLQRGKSFRSCLRSYISAFRFHGSVFRIIVPFLIDDPHFLRHHCFHCLSTIYWLKCRIGPKNVHNAFLLRFVRYYHILLRIYVHSIHTQ